MCGTCVADHMVSCSPVGSTTTERGSMNAGIRRCWRQRRRTTTESGSFSAAAMTSSALGPLVVPAAVESNGNVTHLLEPSSSWTSAESSPRAVSMSRTGGSSS
jgi:hypothetical protein